MIEIQAWQFAVALMAMFVIGVLAGAAVVWLHDGDSG